MSRLLGIVFFSPSVVKTEAIGSLSKFFRDMAAIESLDEVHCTWLVEPDVLAIDEFWQLRTGKPLDHVAWPFHMVNELPALLLHKASAETTWRNSSVRSGIYLLTTISCPSGSSIS
jgi:hypothetical protein